MPPRLSPEVRDALAAGKPVVALESSVVAQGLPPPRNLESWRRCDQAVRRAGAIPATIAVLDGEVWVGLAQDQVERLADPSTPALKLGSGELAIAVALGRTGGTTVSATCEVAAGVGIRIFATGGIGGVHRGAAQTFDVSQDLWALARFPVAVVCAGVKSVLDVPKTLEALETLAVPVVGVGTDELPAFYSTSAGVALAHRVDSPEQAARILRARLEQGTGGMVLALPPPPSTALPAEEVERHLEGAMAEAVRQGITGKRVTPFLLKELSARTHGRALEANVALLEHNAGFAGELATAFAAL